MKGEIADKDIAKITDLSFCSVRSCLHHLHFSPKLNADLCMHFSIHNVMMTLYFPNLVFALNAKFSLINRITSNSNEYFCTCSKSAYIIIKFFIILVTVIVCASCVRILRFSRK